MTPLLSPSPAQHWSDWALHPLQAGPWGSNDTKGSAPGASLVPPSGSCCFLATQEGWGNQSLTNAGSWPGGFPARNLRRALWGLLYITVQYSITWQHWPQIPIPFFTLLSFHSTAEAGGPSGPTGPTPSPAVPPQAGCPAPQPGGP